MLERIVAMENELIHQKLDKESEIARRSKQIYNEVLDNADLISSIPLRARFYKVGIIAAVSSIEAYSSKGRPIKLPCARAYVRCNMMLYNLQVQYLGHNHPDLIASLNALEQGIRSMVAKFPSEANSVFSAMVSLGICSSECSTLGEALQWTKGECLRLKQLYSTSRRYTEALSIYGKSGASYWSEYVA